METLHAWVHRNTMQIVQATEREMERPTPRSSPRRDHSNREQLNPTAEHAPVAAPSSALPARAAHERARQLPMKADAPVRGRQNASRTTSASKVSAETRVKEFANHSLTVRMHEVFCQACKKTLFNKWSSINTHCKMGSDERPSTHARNLQAWNSRTEDDAKLKEDLHNSKK